MKLTEAQLQLNAQEDLNNYFDTVDREVWGNYNGTKKRIDFIVKKDSYVFGIEVKSKKKKKGGDLASWVNQAINYQNFEWNNYGKIPILISSLSWHVFDVVDKNKYDVHKHTDKTGHHNFNGFLGAITGLGEIMKVKNYKGPFYKISYRNYIYKFFKKDFDFNGSGCSDPMKIYNKWNEDIGNIKAHGRIHCTA